MRQAEGRRHMIGHQVPGRLSRVVKVKASIVMVMVALLLPMQRRMPKIGHIAEHRSGLGRYHRLPQHRKQQQDGDSCAFHAASLSAPPRPPLMPRCWAERPIWARRRPPMSHALTERFLFEAAKPEAESVKWTAPAKGADQRQRIRAVQRGVESHKQRG